MASHSSAEERLAALGLSLPDVVAPAAAYQPWKSVDNWIYTAGQLPFVDGKLPATGLLGETIDVEHGQQLAQLAGLNVLAALAEASGGLGNVQMVKATVFVASAPGFHRQHLVANGASELFETVLGDLGRHARSAVGVACLPANSPVEVEAIAHRRA